MKHLWASRGSLGLPWIHDESVAGPRDRDALWYTCPGVSWCFILISIINGSWWVPVKKRYLFKLWSMCSSICAHVQLLFCLKHQIMFCSCAKHHPLGWPKSYFIISFIYSCVHLWIYKLNKLTLKQKILKFNCILVYLKWNILLTLCIPWFWNFHHFRICQKRAERTAKGSFITSVSYSVIFLNVV